MRFTRQHRVRIMELYHANKTIHEICDDILGRHGLKAIRQISKVIVEELRKGSSAK